MLDMVRNAIPELGQALLGNDYEGLEAPEFLAGGLYDLSEFLARRAPDRQHHGMLGGEYGYGQEFQNDVFEMFPFFWGDCGCGHEDAEGAWADAHPHADSCYQCELERRTDAAGDGSPGVSSIANLLAEEWGLPELGCAVHCTCGRDAVYAAWLAEHAHDPRCGVARPNFAHVGSGLRVSWYKYIGRSMTCNQPVTKQAWATILEECRASVRD